MRLALHIFRKDVRYLYREIGLMLALTLLVSRAESLVAIAGMYLIARAIHAETIPGDRQFWLTRPYPWQSLLGAKVLFVIAFINVPLAVAQFVSLAAGGFPIGYELRGLLWSQVLIFVSCLVTMALAAITVGLVPFVFCGLTLLTVYLLKEFALPRASLLAAWPSGIDWISETIVGVVLTAAAVSMILLQYRRRDTIRSMILAFGAVALAALVFVGMPVNWALEAQSWLSTRPSVTTQIQSSLGAIQRSDAWGIVNLGKMQGSANVRFEFPMTLTGLPDGSQVTADRLMMSLEWPGRPTWKSDSIGVTSRTRGVFQGTLLLPQDVYRANLEVPLTLHASLFVTLFGAAESQVIPLRSEPVTAPAGLRCHRVDFPRGASDSSLPPSGLDETRDLACESFFRWPARLVYANSGSADMDFNNLISYSPFPATLSLNPREIHTAGLRPSVTVATIITRKPLAHFRRDFELHGVRLANFEDRKQFRIRR
jgi:hypothetical protein